MSSIPPHAEVTPDGEKITVHSIPAGLYTLVVRDANFDAATQKEGCTHLEVFELPEPPPLELAVEQLLPISCNSANDFNNPSEDGQLLATASGGVPFDPLLDGQYAYITAGKRRMIKTTGSQFPMYPEMYCRMWMPGNMQ